MDQDRSLSTKSLFEAAASFCLPEEILKIELLGSGNINSTFLVHTKDSNKVQAFVMQRVNKQVLKDRKDSIEIKKVDIGKGTKI